MEERSVHTLYPYLRQILKANSNDRHLLGALCSWIWEKAESIGFVIDDDDDYDLLGSLSTAAEKRQVSRSMLLEAKELLLNLLEDAEPMDEEEGSDQENLSLVAEAFRLEDEDLKLFTVFYHYDTDDSFESFVDTISKTFLRVQDVLSVLTGMNRKDILKRLCSEGHLLQTGLLKSEGGNSGYLTSCFKIPTTVSRGLKNMNFNKENFKQLFLGKTPSASLGWEDYEHLNERRDCIATFMKNAIARKESGINILIYGPPGTGKTEFCKILAQQIGVELFSVGEEDEDGHEPSRHDRLSALLLSQNLLRGQGGTMLLFDEIDDLLLNEEGLPRQFVGRGRSGLSKLFMNKLFEQNPVPTIWTLNNIHILDQALLRRMSLAIEFEKPPRKSREKIFKRILSKFHIELDQGALPALIDANVAPAIMNSAVRFAEISESGETGLKFALDNLSSALGTRREQPVKTLQHYNHQLVNADIDLGRLADQLCQQNARAFSLCIYGPPGTGKSEFASYLADRLGMESQVVRASDLFGPFVGETEMAIAKAFRDAREQDTFLIFDEADSLLCDRRDARQSWQISQVNEMLTWMESHPLPFVCTTNLMARLDEASLRRFTFKGHFNYMRPEQVRLAFEHFFNCSAPTDSSHLSTLTPGDFAVVQNKAQLLGLLDHPEQLMDMLAKEGALKDGPGNKTIGFSASC